MTRGETQDIPTPLSAIADGALYPRSVWRSERAYVLATIAGVVGLGNIWRFPYMIGTLLPKRERSRMVAGGVMALGAVVVGGLVRRRRSNRLSLPDVGEIAAAAHPGSPISQWDLNGSGTALTQFSHTMAPLRMAANPIQRM